jgi:hypothetical protein
MRTCVITLVAFVLAVLLAPTIVKAGEGDRNKPTVASLRLRMGNIGQVLLYPPTVPMIEGASAVLFFSGDWGWTPVLQETASWLANHGRYVVGIDSTGYFSRKLEPVDWGRDLRTLRTFVNEKAGLPADRPVIIAGFTWGGELVPYMLNRGGAEGFAGALLIGPDEDSACIYRVTLQMKAKPIPSPPDEQVRVTDELRRMAPIPTVFMHGEKDIESRAPALAGLVRGPHKLVSIPNADKQFNEVRDVYLSIVGQALEWIEHPTAGEVPPPVPQPAPPPAPGPSH